jgi:hypothetical protein
MVSMNSPPTSSLTMSPYEFAVVPTNFSLTPRTSECIPPIRQDPAPVMPNASSWKSISKEAGHYMLVEQRKRVYAATDDVCSTNRWHGNQRPTLAYVFAQSMPTTTLSPSETERGDTHPANRPCVKYTHVKNQQAILVRQSSELEVKVTTIDTDWGSLPLSQTALVDKGGEGSQLEGSPSPPDTAAITKVIASIGTTIVWEKHIMQKSKPQQLSTVAGYIKGTMVRKGLCTWQSKIEWKVDGNVVTTRKHIIKKKG